MANLNNHDTLFFVGMSDFNIGFYWLKMYWTLSYESNLHYPVLYIYLALIYIVLEVLTNEIRPKSGMDSTGNELALVSMEPQRSSFTIAGGPSLSNGYGPHYGSSLYQGSSLGSVPIITYLQNL